MASVYNNALCVGGIYKAVILNEDIQGVQVFVPEFWNEESTMPLNADGSVNQSIYQKYKYLYPVANWCAPNLEAQIHEAGDKCFVVFDTGETNHPTIMGYAGLSIKYIAKPAVDGGDGNSSSSGGTGGTTSVYSNLTGTDLSGSSGWIYPLSQKPQLPISDGRAFGAARSGGRAHAGVDLIVDPGTTCYAMDDGVVTENLDNFLEPGVGSLAIKHADGREARYGEMNSTLSVGTHVTKGQVIGTIPRNSDGNAMLHIEVYAGNLSGSLTQSNTTYENVPQRNYKRRADLLDPTFVASLPTIEEAAAQAKAQQSSGSNSSVVEAAKQYLGTPYVYGGDSPSGFDCSGLVYYVFQKQGKRVPRASQDQYRGGTSVDRGNLQPGDLVFFTGSNGSASSPGHVGIYIGGGEFIHSPQTGDVVKISSLDSGYYQNTYVGARRY